MQTPEVHRARLTAGGHDPVAAQRQTAPSDGKLRSGHDMRARFVIRNKLCGPRLSFNSVLAGREIGPSLCHSEQASRVREDEEPCCLVVGARNKFGAVRPCDKPGNPPPGRALLSHGIRPAKRKILGRPLKTAEVCGRVSPHHAEAHGPGAPARELGARALASRALGRATPDIGTHREHRRAGKETMLARLDRYRPPLKKRLRG